MASVGSSLRDRRSQCDIHLTGWTAVNLYCGKVFRFIEIWQAVNLRLPPERCQCDHAVVQRNTAAQDEVAAVGVGAG